MLQRTEHYGFYRRWPKLLEIRLSVGIINGVGFGWRGPSYSHKNCGGAGKSRAQLCGALSPALHDCEVCNRLWSAKVQIEVKGAVTEPKRLLRQCFQTNGSEVVR